MKRFVMRLMALVLAAAAALASGGVPAVAMQSAFVPSESYAAGEYYQRLLEVELTGDPRQDIVNIALSQLGYREGGMEGDYSGSSRVCNNFTEYGKDLGNPGSIWCTTFIWWCARQAGLDETVFPDTIWPRLLALNIPYVGYTPDASVQPGDILFVENSGDDTSDHLALVTEVTDTHIIAVEGNCGNVVATIAYQRDIGGRADGLGDILYIGYLNYDRDPSVPDASSLTQYVLLTSNAAIYNQHTDGVNQGVAQAGQILQLLAVRGDHRWYQIELEGFAYWIDASRAMIGTVDELNAHLAQMNVTTTETTTTTIVTTTTTTTTASEAQTTTSYLDGINPLTTQSTRETTQPQYAVSVSDEDGAEEGASQKTVDTDKLVLAGMFLLVLAVFTVLVLMIKKKASSRKVGET